MTDNKSIPKKSNKANELTHHARKLDSIKGVTGEMIGVGLPRETISDALKAVLESQGRYTELSDITKNMPGAQLQKAIDATLAPSKAVAAALDNLPGAQLRKTMESTLASSRALATALDNIPHTAVQKTTLDIASGVASQNFDPPIPVKKSVHEVGDLGTAVRKVRKAKSMTQQEFADLAGVGRRFLSELEQGKQTLEIGKVLQVLAAAGIQLVYSSSGTNK